jgi:hypothetical protein
MWGTSDTHPGFYRVSPVASFSACPSHLTALRGTRQNALDLIVMQKVVGSNPISRFIETPANAGVFVCMGSGHPGFIR